MQDQTFVVENMPHSIGNHRCEECFSGFPKRCQCKGLIHAQFVKEDWEGGLNLVYLCDYCGKDYKFPVVKKVPKYRPKYKR